MKYTFIWIIESLSQNIHDKGTARPFLESDKSVKIWVLLKTASETVGVVSKVMLKYKLSQRPPGRKMNHLIPYSDYKTSRAPTLSIMNMNVWKD